MISKKIPTITVVEAVRKEQMTSEAYNEAHILAKTIHVSLNKLSDYQKVVVCHEIEMYVKLIELTVRKLNKENIELEEKYEQIS